MTTLSTELKQSKILEFADLLKQRNDAAQKKELNLELTEYETALINSPYEDWLKISAMLNCSDIEENIYNDFLQYPSHYKIENNFIVYDEDWEEKEAQKEAERIANLHITKQDFYKALCQPAGISYNVLLAKVQEVGMVAEWDTCNHIYYGVIKPFLQVLPLGKTEEEIIQIFEALCTKE